MSMNQQFYPHPDQITMPGPDGSFSVPPSNIKYMPQYSQPPPNRPAVGSPGGFHIDMAPNELSGPNSLDYSSPVRFSYLFAKLHNPELEEEFDISNLGIDLQTSEPLLPNIYYAGSDNPLINYGQFPASNSYPRDESKTSAINRISQFSDDSLLFIFYIHARDKLQNSAFAELKKRGYSYDSKKRIWSNPAKLVFDINKWKFVTPDSNGQVPS